MCFSTSQNLKPKAEGFAKGGIKYNAGSEFATAVYKKRYIRAQIHNHDCALAHPPYPSIDGITPNTFIGTGDLVCKIKVDISESVLVEELINTST